MNTLSKFNDIKTFIFDVDGVLTNSNLLVTENGDLLRTVNTRDGFAIRMALDKGYNVFIITGGGSEGVTKRFSKLGIPLIYSKVKDKKAKFEELVSERRLDPQQVLYMGDDLVDYEVMQRVGLPACPSDAVPEIVALSKYVSHLEGGKGCVRDVIERVLKLHDNWFIKPV